MTSSSSSICVLCGLSFASKTLLKKHEESVHNIKQHNQSFECSTCGYESTSLFTQDVHYRNVHATNLLHCCIYCSKTFSSHSLFEEHTIQGHGLPTADSSITLAAHESAFGGTLRSFILAGSPQSDLLDYMVTNEPEITSLVNTVCQNKAQKVRFVASVELYKPYNQEEQQKSIEIFTNSNTEIIYAVGMSRETFLNMVNRMILSVINFASNGSGWVVKAIHQLEVKFAKFTPLTSGCYIALPAELQGLRNVLLNVENKYDDNCFIYCYVAAYHYKYGPSLAKETDNWRTKFMPATYSTRNSEAHQPDGTFDMPMPLHQIPRFEDLNGANINVFRVEGKELFPLVVSRKSSDLVIDLLLLHDEVNHHYVLIRDLKKLFASLRGKSVRKRDVLCRNCFHVCSDVRYLSDHQSVCFENECAVIQMPKVGSNTLVYKNLASRWLAPVAIYFDIESIIRPIATCSNRPSISSTQALEKHEPCGVAYAVIEAKSKRIIDFKLRRSPDCMDWFVEAIESLAHKIYKWKRQQKVYHGTQTPPADNSLIKCWICDTHFTNEDPMVLDHDHYDGSFIGWAHRSCNIKRKTIAFTPVIAHNLKNYDLHHVCNSIHKLHCSSRLFIVPANTEKYISISIAVLVKEYVDVRGKMQRIYEYLRLIDSYQFMLSSLNQLVETLPDTKFDILYTHFRNKQYTDNQISLLKKKGHYPYAYIVNEDKFEDHELPPLSEWRNRLQNDEISITEQQLEEAKHVFHTFGCQNMGDYHDLYLTCDTLLLACVTEEFRSSCYNTYGLDCLQYFTISNFCGDALMKVTGQPIELLTDREHLEMCENLVRGGIASCFESRHEKANNKHQVDFNPTIPSTYIMMFDANNLYGSMMEHLPLPYGNFSFRTNIDIEAILKTSESSATGYIVDCDLLYPDELHDIHSDFPLAPEKMIVNGNLLGSYQRSLAEKLAINTMSGQKKLLQTLYNKRRYTVHYLTLQLYVSLGMKVEKVHRVLQFSQSKWMQSYIRLNTEMRQSATSKFHQNHFKQMNNSAFGKLCESKRKRKNVSLVRTRSEATQRISTPLYESFTVFNENLAAITSSKQRIYWNRPTIIGAVILDLSKMHMFRFHYTIMKKQFQATLLYSDTDSLVYKIRSRDVYSDMNKKPFKDHLDFSNYEPGHKLYDSTHKMETLRFKDEMGGKVIREFCCLKPKMYSILYEGEYSLKVFLKKFKGF